MGIEARPDLESTTPDHSQDLVNSIHNMDIQDNFSFALQHQYISSLHGPKRSVMFGGTKYEDNFSRIYLPFDSNKDIVPGKGKTVKDKLVSTLGFMERNPKNNDLYEFKVFNKGVGTSSELKDEKQLMHIKIDTSKSKPQESIKYTFDKEEIDQEEVTFYLKTAKQFLNSYRGEQEHLLRQEKVADIRRREFEERKRLDAEGLLDGM